METKTALEFDPGFAPYILAFQGTVQYLYTDINRFKNLSQKKTKFMQYHKKILDIFYNNVGFYVGCLMWAVYLKAQNEGEILSNHCYGTKYDENENVLDTQYMLKFVELFPKDMKYYLGKDFLFEPDIIKLIKTYEEFLVLNKGFTETKLNSDLILPKAIKTDNADIYKTFIDKSIANGNLTELKEHITDIL
ncbi:MAG: hypothetical protein MJ230_01170 [bacterium]|nr:hypothetical protein [bacterium]